MGILVVAKRKRGGEVLALLLGNHEERCEGHRDFNRVTPSVFHVFLLRSDASCMRHGHTLTIALCVWFDIGYSMGDGTIVWWHLRKLHPNLPHAAKVRIGDGTISLSKENRDPSASQWIQHAS